MSCVTYLPGLVLALVAVVSSHRTPCCSRCSADNEERYSYRGSRNGPNQWPTLFPVQCNGTNQSPININTDSLQKGENLTQLLLKNYDIPIQNATMVNNGHTVQIMPGGSERRTIVVYGVEYDLAQFHFHWGCNSAEGSEHTINNNTYLMEMHLVHMASDGRIAVVAVLFKEGHDKKNGLLPIVNSLSDVKYKNENTTLKYPLVLRNLLPKNPASFYRYNGSLTTPNCNEGVVWSVIPDPIPVEHSQMKKFRALYSITKEEAMEANNRCCLIAPNFRPPQPLNDRQVYRSE